MLLELEYFNFLYCIPAEFMHLVCLGCVKRLLELCFAVGESCPRNITRKLTSTAQFNKLISSVKVPSEFSRRIRDLDFAVYKGEEFRNLILFLFPVVLECLEQEVKEKRVWLLLAYIIRGTIIPEDEYSCLLYTSDAADE